MATKYSQIPTGTIFEAKGGKFRKVDDLYYEDLQTGFQAVWNPMFDDGINRPAAEAPKTSGVNTKDEFLVDEQTRRMTPNPDYKKATEEAVKWFGEMWGSGEFDCGPEDYEWMALTAIGAVRALKALPAVVPTPTSEPQVYKALKKKSKARVAAKKVTKKPAKSVKKSAPKKNARKK
jgi:hypothetical protein